MKDQDKPEDSSDSQVDFGSLGHALVKDIAEIQTVFAVFVSKV